MFEYSLISITSYGYKLNEVSLDLHATEIENVETEYERKFSAKGFPIYRLDATLYKNFTVKK